MGPRVLLSGLPNRVDPPPSLLQGLSFRLRRCVERVSRERRKLSPAWLHRYHPAQVTAQHFDVIPTISRMTLFPLCKFLAQTVSVHH
jgi:hypothetical protein